MGSRARYTPSVRNFLLILLGLAIVALLLPRAWTAPLMSLVQVLAPFQAATTDAGNALSNPAMPVDVPRSPEQVAALHHEVQALRHQVASLTALNQTLQDENELLTAVRLHDWGGTRIGPVGQLIPARVIARDVVAWRSSRLVDAGALRGVQPGTAVTTRAFEIDQGDETGVRDGLAVLLAESMVGIIESTGTHTAQVRLLSDPQTEMRVRIGRFRDDAFELAPQNFWLTGKGRGRIEIGDVDAQLVDTGAIAVGDLVLSDPTDAQLPAALTIGRIEQIETDRSNPLLRILHVAPSLPEDALRRVYVYDPTPPGGA